MSFVGGGLSIGGPGDPLRFGQTRGRIGNSFAQGVNYPSPFFDLAHTYFPATVKSLFRWCRYYFLTNPIVNTVVFKLSEYPVTDIIIDHPSKEVVNRWTEYFTDHLQYKPFMVECGLDYFVYGTTLPAIVFPLKKFLTCNACGFMEEAKKIRPHWSYTNYEFRLTCPKCGDTGSAKAHDLYFKNAGNIRLMRWNPEDIDVRIDDLSGEATYFYNVQNTLKNDAVVGKKDVVEKTPQVILQAMRQQKSVVLTKDLVFQMRRPSLSGQDRGYGTPLLLASLKNLFYLQIMQKAQETVLSESILPLRVMFPQLGSGQSDPYSTVNLVDWRDHVAMEIARWRRDPNYIPILPLPVGAQTIGGDGRALLLTQELQLHGEQLINGLQCPLEFVKGGLSFSGSSVSMRMMENHFISYISRHKQLANWIMRQIASYMDWPVAKIRFKPFKMADDIQRKAYLFQLNQVGKISDTTLLADADLNQEEENDIMLRETTTRTRATEKQQLAMAEIQGKQQAILMKQQIKSQQEMQEAMASPNAPGEPGGPDEVQMGSSMLGGEQQRLPMGQGEEGEMQPGAGGVDLLSVASGLASQLANMDPASQHAALQQIKSSSPEILPLVLQFLTSMGAFQQQQQGVPGANGAAAGQVNMQPLPEAKAPRRAAQSI